jgi:hypothetical protein
MKKKVIAGLAVSALLVYLSIRGIDFMEVASGFRTIRPAYLLLSLALMLFMQVLRSYRWGLILRPLAKVDQLSLFSVTSVGFLAIIAIPARLGELARPYLITQRSGIMMSSALGTVLVERVLDGLTVLAIAVGTLWLIPLPPWLVGSGFLFLTVTIALLGVVVLMIFQQQAALKILAPLFAILPAGYADRIRRLIAHVIEGFRIMSNPTLMISVTALSLLIWIVDVLVIYVLFLAFGWGLPLAASLALMIILIIGIAIPTAPGFIGNWHYFCVLGLDLFDVPRPDALTFAILYHALSVGVIASLGLVFLPFNRLPVSSLREKNA